MTVGSEHETGGAAVGPGVGWECRPACNDECLLCLPAPLPASEGPVSSPGKLDLEDLQLQAPPIAPPMLAAAPSGIEERSHVLGSEIPPEVATDTAPPRGTAMPSAPPGLPVEDTSSGDASAAAEGVTSPLRSFAGDVIHRLEDMHPPTLRWPFAAPRVGGEPDPLLPAMVQQRVAALAGGLVSSAPDVAQQVLPWAGAVAAAVVISTLVEQALGPEVASDDADAQAEAGEAGEDAAGAAGGSRRASGKQQQDEPRGSFNEKQDQLQQKLNPALAAKPQPDAREGAYKPSGSGTPPLWVRADDIPSGRPRGRHQAKSRADIPRSSGSSGGSSGGSGNNSGSVLWVREKELDEMPQVAKARRRRPPGTRGPSTASELQVDAQTSEEFNGSVPDVPSRSVSGDRSGRGPRRGLRRVDGKNAVALQDNMETLRLRDRIRTRNEDTQ
ncbi:hypothetical protein CYMTET_23440 [Cymbomonas tetramitiformis]|uniref:Uncharacterized protein n=1 Tax=Cymbomonas tetramitiformis TaxID=36881 RepID=A0AAE0FYB6_9CHLO|nr:hypothetical protein CYMTET_23440 [Cymbomonas tetramitiformis]